MHFISLLGLSAFLANTVIASPAPSRAMVSCNVDLTSNSSHHNQYQVKAAMVDRPDLPDGVYRMYLGCHEATISSEGPEPGNRLILLPPGNSLQTFQSNYHSESGAYTFQLDSSDFFISSDYVELASPLKIGNAMGFVLHPIPQSDARYSFFVSPARYHGSTELAISESPVPIYPPMVAFMPAGPSSIVTFQPA